MNAAATQFRITESDYVNAMKLHARPGRIAWRALTLVALVLLLGGALGEGIVRVLAWSGLVGIALGLFCGPRWLAPSLHRRHYRQYKLMHAPMWVHMDAQSLHLGSEQANARIAWEQIMRWREDRDYVLVYIMPRLFYILPKAIEAPGFPLQALLQRLREQLGEPR